MGGTTLNFGLLIFRNQKVWIFVHILITTRKNAPNEKMNKCLTFLKVEFFLKSTSFYLRKIVINNTLC